MVDEVKLGTDIDAPALLVTAGCVSSRVGLAEMEYTIACPALPDHRRAFSL
jgi:2-keto-3-deoxy-galactonokinase